MKSQSVAEFIVIFGIFLAALIVITLVSWSRIEDMSQSKKDMEIERVLVYTSDKINTAYLIGNGFSTNMTLPETILNFNYTADIQNGMLLLNITGMIYSKQLLTTNITVARSLDQKGPYVIKNNKGEIIIS